MGDISRKLTTLIDYHFGSRGVGPQELASFTPPPDVKDIRQLIEEGDDPAHAAYVSTQNFACQHDAIFLAGLPDVKGSLPHGDLARPAPR